MLKFIRMNLSGAVTSLSMSLLFVLIAILILMGTIIEVQNGLTESNIFNSWLYLVDKKIPVPGLKSIGIVFMIYLLLAVVKLIKSKKWSICLIHISILLLICSSYYESFTRKVFFLTIQEGEILPFITHTEGRSGELPDCIKLNRFIIDYWPGSINVKDYKSSISFYKEDRIVCTAMVTMNKPFVFKDYSFYQASYQMLDNKIGTTLQIVKSKSRAVPYVCTSFLLLGCLLLLVKKN
jgi:hypothetical protein